MSLINPSRVHEIFLGSMWPKEECENLTEAQQDEMIARSKIGQGIRFSVVFSPARLESHRAEIAKMLLSMEPDFMESFDASGMSFLRAPLDKEANQWGEQQNAEELLTLGLALGWVSFPLPRETWIALPGGVPYVIVHDKKIKEDLEKQDEVR